ncbi:hypothetical protein QEP73_01590 [Pseudomonas defluvii]|uniref:hypothetical protein n=1 Tax=Pseudomonas TaxID=286 RepID=UPI00249AEA30|nr:MULTISPECIES: hypothetical protein [Pseudomonas]WJM98968.1 hypothetical protein QEP73_01590 [Pseudomonas defluvii]
MKTPYLLSGSPAQVERRGHPSLACQVIVPKNVWAIQRKTTPSLKRQQMISANQRSGKALFGKRHTVGQHQLPVSQDL